MKNYISINTAIARFDTASFIPVTSPLKYLN